MPSHGATFSKGTYASADKSPTCAAAALAFALPPTFEICGLTNASTAPLWKTASFEEICPPPMPVPENSVKPARYEARVQHRYVASHL